MVVVLRDVYDLPHEAIARELGISQTAAKVRLHRARRRLREQLFPSAAAAAGAGRQRPRPRQRSRPVVGGLAGAEVQVGEPNDRAAAV